MASVVAVRPEILADVEVQLRRVARSIEELRAAIDARAGTFGASGPEAAWRELCQSTEIAKINVSKAVMVAAQALAEGAAAFTRVDVALAGHLGGFVGVLVTTFSGNDDDVDFVQAERRTTEYPPPGNAFYGIYRNLGTVKDYAPGSPPEIRRLADHSRALADRLVEDAGELSSVISRTDSASWQGQFHDQFRTVVDPLPEVLLHRIVPTLQRAAEELVAYAARLEILRSEARTHLRSGQAGEKRRVTAGELRTDTTQGAEATGPAGELIVKEKVSDLSEVMVDAQAVVVRSLSLLDSLRDEKRARDAALSTVLDEASIDLKTAAAAVVASVLFVAPGPAKMPGTPMIDVSVKPRSVNRPPAVSDVPVGGATTARPDVGGVDAVGRVEPIGLAKVVIADGLATPTAADAVPVADNTTVGQHAAGPAVEEATAVRAVAASSGGPGGGLVAGAGGAAVLAAGATAAVAARRSGRATGTTAASVGVSSPGGGGGRANGGSTGGGGAGGGGSRAVNGKVTSGGVGIADRRTADAGDGVGWGIPAATVGASALIGLVVVAAGGGIQLTPAQEERVRKHLFKKRRGIVSRKVVHEIEGQVGRLVAHDAGVPQTVLRAIVLPGGLTADVPSSWCVASDDTCAVLTPGPTGSFASNIVIVADRNADTDARSGISDLSDPVLLEVEPVKTAISGARARFGYTTDAAALTVHRWIVQAPAGGTVVATATVATDRLAVEAPVTDAVLASLRPVGV